MTVEEERSYWDGLSDDEADINTAGVPPYDVEAVARYIIDKLVPPREFHRWLDLGCGTGRLTRAVARLAIQAEVTGIDISRALLARAMRAPDNCPGCSIVFRLGDGRTLPERAGMFDAAYSITMFQHIPRDAQRGYLFEVAKHLRPGAPFLFTVAVGGNDVFLDHQVNLERVWGWVDEAGMDRDWQWHAGWTWLRAKRRG